MVSIIILYDNIIILWDHLRIRGPLLRLTETSLCGAYLYLSVTSFQVTKCSLNQDLHKKGPSFTTHTAETLCGVPNYLDPGFVTPFNGHQVRIAFQQPSTPDTLLQNTT